MIASYVARTLDRGATTFMLVLLALAIVVPALNLAVPPSSPFHLPIYLETLFGKYACYALLALSIDLIWGYCGILSLGHGAFFALGGYAMGMYLMRQIGTRGVYANPILPDFMVFLNWPELPVYWYGFQHFAYAALMVVLVPGVLASVFGWFAFRSRVTGVYLSIITQALTYALMLGFFRNNFGFGGNNGLTDFKDILGFNVQAPGTRAALYTTSVVALIVGFVICRAIVTSKLGKVLIAIRDAEARTRFLGYRVESYKLFVFTLSACMAGVAGALYVPQVGIINPSEFAPGNSIEAVIWVAVGGRGTLTGAVVGAVLVNYAKTTFTSGTVVPYWAFGVATLIALAAVLVVRSRVWVGALVGLAAAAFGLLLAGPLLAAARALDQPSLMALAANMPLLVAGLFAVVALAMSWHPFPLGAVFGALLFVFFATPFEAVGLAPYWLFALGGLFVAVTLLLPRGIVGTFRQSVDAFHRWWSARRARKAALGDAGAPMPAPRPAE
jgi:urea transport system permease protein